MCVPRGTSVCDATRSRASHRALRRIAEALLLAALGGSVTGAWAQAPLLDDVHTIADPTAAAPVEFDFSVSTAGTYQIKLTDLGAVAAQPAPLSSITFALTSNDALVGAPVVGTGVPTSSMQFTAAAPGSYRLHVVGTPGNSPGSGPIGIQVTDSANNVVFSGSGTIALPQEATPGSVATIEDTLPAVATGTYTVTLTDFDFPEALQTLELLLIDQSTGSAVGTPLIEGSTPLTESVQLNANDTYQILVVGQANASAIAGLFAASVSPASGPPAYSKTVPIGAAVLLGSSPLAASPYNVSLNDLAFPAALTQLSAVLVCNGQVLQTLQVTPPATQSTATVTPAGACTVQTFAVATAAAASANSPGAGSYALQILAQDNTPQLSVAQGVVAAGGALSAFSYVANLAASGAYTVNLHDFQLPVAAASLRLGAVQNGALIGTPITGAGSISISNANAGPLTILAFAQGGAPGGSLVDVNVTNGGGTVVFDQPQAIGAAFATHQISITTPGWYQVTATDLGFPANFQDLAVLVTQGSTLTGELVVGSASSGGSSCGAACTLTFQVTAGANYFFNFLATPQGSDKAGTYALNVSPAPPSPPPAVTLKADSMSVSAGATVNLSWTTQNAVSCTGSGGGWSGSWTGSQAATGSGQSPAISSTTTFTLTCQGPGGSGNGSVTVTVSDPPKGGGGGALGIPTLLVLTLLLLHREARLARVASQSKADESWER